MKKYKKAPYFYVLPALIFLIIFVYYPIIQNFIYSFFRMSSYSTTRTFIGFENYIRLLQDPTVKIAIKNNVYYAIISLVFQVGLGLVIAIVLESKIVGKFKTFYRTVYFIPSIISITVVSILWWFIYRPDIGMLNSLLRLIGLDNLAAPWLGNSKTAIFAVIAMSQWHYTGYIAMLLIVAIQKVPKEMYEAANIDGANGWQKALYITIPQIKGMLVVTSVITLSGAFKVFNEVHVMTKGGPGNASQVLGTYMNKAAWVYDEVGYAATIGVLIFTITFIAAVVQIRLSGFEKEDGE
ncbi:carbohydrate ABC transporter permease [Fusibacter bizertensis]